jgi:glutamine cyclotransferase
MAKRQKRRNTQPTGIAWSKGLVWLIALIVLILAVTALTTQPGRQLVRSALLGTATPTPTATATPSPTFTPTPLPTATSTFTPTPTPNSVLPALATVTPTLPLTETVQVPVYRYRIINTYPHDRAAFTQGLVYEDGFLYEGTGRRGQSTLRKVELESGQVLQSIALPPILFGEGIVIFGDRIVQLTWHARIGFVYDKASFELQQSFGYPTEGWGITHDGQQLIMSDGTSTLYFWDPETLAEIGRVEVTDSGRPVPRLNELEYVQGEVFANIWQTDRIARVDPNTGHVVGWIDLAGLLGPEDLTEPVDVLNGIAYDAAGDRLFVTGKLWPKLFEIELVAPDQG